MDIVLLFYFIFLLLNAFFIRINVKSNLSNTIISSKHTIFNSSLSGHNGHLNDSRIFSLVKGPSKFFIGEQKEK